MIREKKKNQGNSYIMVVATLSFLAILVAALLVAISVLYKLKAYDINSRDNFYYLEQAMDEIYAGIGSDSMKLLSESYNDTVEVLVYYDMDSKSYITMTNDEANAIFRSTYLQKVNKYYVEQIGGGASGGTVGANVQAYLYDFISNPYSSSNTEGVQLSVGNVARQTVDGVDGIVFMNVVLKREAYYSTINARTANEGDAIADKFVQTITTDIAVTTPDFNVNFDRVGSELNDLYSFSILADLGLEINGAATNVDITGNVYAASDFYNKDYNIKDNTNPNYPGDEAEYTTINEASYEDENYNGKTEKSMYSGIYIGGSNVVISADRLIVPGTIAAMNKADLTISGATVQESEVWADGIVMGGYSLTKATNKDATGGADPSADKETVEGASITMRANAYISDDLELNATASNFTLTGNYYGYNYASTDNRTYNGSVTTKDGRSFVAKVQDTIKDGTTIEGQNHYNSSSIIINGEKSSLDLKGVESMYIAGQAYVELSKQTDTKEVDVKNLNGTNVLDEGKELDEIAKDAETTDVKTYDYADITTETDKDGKTSITDNYTVSTKDRTNATTIQDYRTGEAISIKSNQLAYIPNWAVTDTKDGLYLSIPEGYRSSELWKTKDGESVWDNLAKVPVIKSVISGKTYYFLDFSDAKEGMNEYIEKFASLFTLGTGEKTSKGEILGLQDITNYKYFQIEMLNVKDTDDTGKLVTEANGNLASIYSNSAISIKTGNTITIKASSSSIEPLIAAANTINENIDKHNSVEIEKEDGTIVKLDEASISTESVSAASLAGSVTTKLQEQYKEVKWLLSPQSTNPEGITQAHDMAESDMTPLNYFINYNLITKDWTKTDLLCGYSIYVKDGDLELKNEDIKGIVICNGNVTFTDDVKDFEGLIIAGGKVIVNHSMSFLSNEEIVKSILRECDELQIDYKSGVKFYELFRLYNSFYVDADDSGVGTKSLRDVSSVQFEDVIGFRNWAKNVD